jgi:hypothetical protein
MIGSQWAYRDIFKMSTLLISRVTYSFLLD